MPAARVPQIEKFSVVTKQQVKVGVLFIDCQQRPNRLGSRVSVDETPNKAHTSESTRCECLPSKYIIKRRRVRFLFDFRLLSEGENHNIIFVFKMNYCRRDGAHLKAQWKISIGDMIDRR